jgi:hypothetical protein
VNRFCSIFNQLLQLFPRNQFEQTVGEFKGERHARGFRCWDQFVAMMFCQLGRAHSLREICGGLASCEGKLAHLGMEKAPHRSTLSYANEHRSWQLYEAIFYQLLERCRQASGQGRRFRFKNKLVSMDSTVIELCASLFDWAQFVCTKGAVKLHLLLDHDGYLPSFAVITDRWTSDIEIARRMGFPPGSIVVVDRGYADFGWFDGLTDQKVFFVTRAKKDWKFQVLQALPVRAEWGELSHQVVRLGRGRHGGGRHCFRRIELQVEGLEEPLVLLTNHMGFAMRTVGDIYKERWQIELFFKAIKQNLRIKTFVGTSANALKIQIWTALIAMLILRLLQLRSRWKWSLSNLVALLRMNLFVHRDLWQWLHDPFSSSPPLPQPLQSSLSFA